MPGYSLMAPLNSLAGREPDVEAVFPAQGGLLSRNEFVQRVRTIARGFISCGLQPGDRVLFAVRPDAGGILLMLGIAEAGGVLIPLDTSMGPELFRSRMELLAPQWVVAESVLYSATASRWTRRLLGLLGIGIPRLTHVQSARFVHVGCAWPGVPEGLSAGAIERLGESSNAGMPVPAAEDTAIIVFTSGTTDAPKAVMHSRRSMMRVLEIIGTLLNARPGDRIYARELHIILPALYAGAAVVIPARSGFSARRVMRDFRKYGVTHFFGVAAELQLLVSHLSSRKQKMPVSLREIWTGAAPVRTAFLQALQELLSGATQVWCVYGMTEILPVARVSLAEKVAFEGQGDLVGECVPGVGAQISADGELVLSGPNLFSGYFGEPPCTAHCTGDLARLDQGRIVLLGRCKDMIIRGRFNIYPELYEATVEKIPGVRRCAMFGVYDAGREDEYVILAVEPDTSVNSRTLKNNVANALRAGPFSIDAEALPDDILVMALPMAGRSAKVDKQALRLHAQRCRRADA